MSTTAQKAHNLTITKLGSYKKIGKGGVLYTVFRYAVKGSPEAIAAFEAAQGTNFRKDEASGTPLYFTTKFCGESAKLIVNGTKVYPDMSEYDAAASLASQYGGNMGQAIATAAAAKLFGGANVATETPANQETEGKM